LEFDRERLRTIRATLYVNFVERDVGGVQIDKAEFDKLESRHGTLGLLVHVIDSLVERIEMARERHSRTQYTGPEATG
jgi:hypothetical protein